MHIRSCTIYISQRLRETNKKKDPTISPRGKTKSACKRREIFDATESRAGNTIFNKIIAYRARHHTKKSCKCEKNLRGETGSRFIHIPPRPWAAQKARALSLYAILTIDSSRNPPRLPTGWLRTCERIRGIVRQLLRRTEVARRGRFSDQPRGKIVRRFVP